MSMTPQQAKEQLDAHVRETIEQHFNPETGTPFWVEAAQGKNPFLKLDFDPRKAIKCFEDLKKFGLFEDDWLRGGPVRRWLPYIPISNLRDISEETRHATLHEGELFGEMSCMYGSPRSATIVAAGDCFVLEMLRNILDEIQGDEGYRAHVDGIYRERVLQNHLRRLPIFSDLT